MESKVEAKSKSLSLIIAEEALVSAAKLCEQNPVDSPFSPKECQMNLDEPKPCYAAWRLTDKFVKNCNSYSLKQFAFGANLVFSLRLSTFSQSSFSTLSTFLHTAHDCVGKSQLQFLTLLVNNEEACKSLRMDVDTILLDHGFREAREYGRKPHQHEMSRNVAKLYDAMSSLIDLVKNDADLKNLLESFIDKLFSSSIFSNNCSNTFK
jgi:hypothetical protein